MSNSFLIIPFLPFFTIGEILLWILVGGFIGGAIGKLCSLLFKNKTTLLTGPMMSGKTTFLQAISKDTIESGPTGAPKRYEIEDAVFDVVTDMGGGEEWMQGNFDKYINDHDYILFFFDINEYLSKKDYEETCKSRMYFIHTSASSDKKILLIATHFNLVGNSAKTQFERSIAGKSYSSLLEHIVYVDFVPNAKEAAETILKKLDNY